MYDTLKIVDLNPTVSDDQLYDLLCEKFSSFPDVNINIANHGKNRVAYLYFNSQVDAHAALKKNSCIAMFGYACRATPVYDKPVSKGSSMTDPALGDNYEAVAEYSEESFRKSEEDEQASLSHDECKASPQRQRGDYRSSRVHGARWLNRRGSWQRGFGFSRGRGRSRPYLLTSTRYRGGQKPYFLTKSSRDDEQISHTVSAVGSQGGHKPYMSETTDEKVEKEPNSTLYIGSMDPSVKAIDLKRLFNNFGFVLDVGIKIPSPTQCFAFIHFLTMDMAQLAKQEMDGKPIGRSIPRLGYGRSVENKCLWVGGLGSWTNEDMLRLEFGQFGEIEKLEWPKNRDYAFVVFSSVQDAVDAKQVMHGSHHGEPPHSLRVTYATHVQMTSDLNYRHEFPQFPIKRIVSRFPEKRASRDRQSPVSHQKRRSSERSRMSRDREFHESHRRRRRSLERARSRSRSRPRKNRSRSPSRKHLHVRSRRKERSPSPYARNISPDPSLDNMSSISDVSSENDGLTEKDRARKRHQKSSIMRSPANKLLRNPSPPKLMMKDERTVVLRSEPQLVSAASDTTAGAFTSVGNQLYNPAVPSYVPPVDHVVYYPPVANTLPPTMYPPPMHIPPPDFYTLPNPVVPQFPQHLPPLVSYPPVGTDSVLPMPVVCQPDVPAVQSSTYLPHSVTAPVKETQKPTNVSVAAKFPKVWSGALVLRNAAFVVDFHLLSGNVLLVNSLLGSDVESGSEADCPVLKITQRLRLDQPGKLDELEQRLKKVGHTGCSVLLAKSAPAQVDDDANVVQQYPLSNLVSYLLQKQVAAIVSLPPGSSDAAKATGVLHAFPPCQFATDFLRKEAPGLPANCPTEEELLVVLCEF